MNIEFPPNTDFDPSKALDLLDDAERIITEYEALTRRSFSDDRDLRNRIESHADDETIGQGLDVDNAMVAFYAAGKQVSIWGDHHTAEALYFKMVGDVDEAMEDLGILQDEPEDEDPDPPTYYDGPSAAETYRQHWVQSVELHS